MWNLELYLIVMPLALGAVGLGLGWLVGRSGSPK